MNGKCDRRCAVVFSIVGLVLLAGTACEDKECKDALANQTAALEAAKKAQAVATAELNAIRAKLAAKDAELAQVKKGIEAATSDSAAPTGTEATSGRRNPIQVPHGLGLAVPEGGVCRTAPERWTALQTLVQAYMRPVRQGQHTKAIKAVEIALPQLENAVRVDPYCLPLIAALVGAYDARIGAYVLSSNQGSGIVVPLTDCNVTFGLAAIARIEKFAAKDDPVRTTVAEIEDRLQSFRGVQRQVEPDCR